VIASGRKIGILLASAKTGAGCNSTACYSSGSKLQRSSIFALPLFEPTDLSSRSRLFMQASHSPLCPINACAQQQAHPQILYSHTKESRLLRVQMKIQSALTRPLGHVAQVVRSRDHSAFELFPILNVNHARTMTSLAVVFQEICGRLLLHAAEDTLR
jgi:hypothetical protein